MIVASAGRGARAGGEPKQFRLVAGVPMLLRAIQPFLAHSAIDTVVVVVPEAEAIRPPRWLQDLAGERLILVPGGATRSESVRAGLAALPAHCTTVLVHDGARPFVSTLVIEGVMAAARAGQAAIAALPIHDSVKRIAIAGDGQMQVTETVPRNALWRASTPQGFPRQLLVRAHEGNPGASDDAALVEAMGETVILVPDSPQNLKITTADDFLLAEALAGLLRP